MLISIKKGVNSVSDFDINYSEVVIINVSYYLLFLIIIVYLVLFDVKKKVYFFYSFMSKNVINKKDKCKYI